MLRNLTFATLKTKSLVQPNFKVDYAIIDILSLIFSTN